MDLYLHHAGATCGPFDAAELQARVRAGELPAQALSWRAGEPRWTSLARRWRTPSAARRDRVAAVLAGACAPLAVVLVNVEHLLPWSMRSLPWIAGLAGALLLAGIVATIALARGSRRLVGRVTAGPLYAAYTLTLVTLLLAGNFTQRWILENEPQDWDDAQFRLVDDGRSLRIDGGIGERFVDDLDARLQAAPRLERIVIRSEGGYVEQALEAGERIRARGLAVRVHDTCASACVLLWSRSPRREMEPEAQLGLHRTRVDGRAPGQWKQAMVDASDAHETQALREAGFTDALLARRAGTGPDDMAWFDVATLQDDGLEFAIVDAAGRPVPPQQARLAPVIAMLGADTATRRMLVALRDRLPDVLELHAPALRGALDSPDEHDVTRATMAAGASARVVAVERAPDAAVVAWGRRVQALFAQAARSGSEADCRILMGEAPPPPESALQANLAAAYADLFEAVPATGAPPRRTDPRVLQGASRAAYLDALRQGRDGPPTAWPVRAQCAFMRDVYAHVLREPAPRAARAVLTLDRHGGF